MGPSGMVHFVDIIGSLSLPVVLYCIYTHIFNIHFLICIEILVLYHCHNTPRTCIFLLFPRTCKQETRNSRPPGSGFGTKTKTPKGIHEKNFGRTTPTFVTLDLHLRLTPRNHCCVVAVVAPSLLPHHCHHDCEFLPFHFY